MKPTSTDTHPSYSEGESDINGLAMMAADLPHGEKAIAVPCDHFMVSLIELEGEGGEVTKGVSLVLARQTMPGQAFGLHSVLSAREARTVAASLLELANEIDGGKTQ